MLLRRLLDYAEAHPDAIPPAYHTTKPVRWVCDLAGMGGPIRLVDLADPTDRTRRNGTPMLVPSVTKTSGVAPTLAVDTVEYAFGWVAEGRKPARVAAQHEAFLRLVDEWVAADPDGPGRVLQAFYAGGHDRRVTAGGEWAHDQLVAFRNGDEFLHATESARRFWATVASGRKGSGRRGLCLVCGQVGELLKTIPQQAPARLFPGATQSVSLVSVNKATHGFDLTEKLVYTPICDDCGLRVMAALEVVLSSETGSLAYPGQNGRMAWWSTAAETDWLHALIEANPQQVQELLRSVHSGLRPGDREVADAVECFCSVVVGGNVARAVVRSWIDVPLRTAQLNLTRWFDDHAVVDGWTGELTHLPVGRLASATGRWKPGHGDAHGSYAKFGEKGEDRPADIFPALVNTALLGKPLPPRFLAHLVHRIRTDGRVDTPRTALLRLALRRRPGIADPHPERYMPTLNDTNDDPAYLAGRLFALLEGLQFAASRKRGDDQLNVTYADRYFARAVSNPRLVLVAGRRDAQPWLRRLRRDAPKLFNFYNREIDHLFARLVPSGIPYGVGVAQQAAFILGYSQQRTHKRIAADTGATDTTDTTDPEGEQQ